MKKAISLILALILVVSFCSCGSTASSNTSNEVNETNTNHQQEESTDTKLTILNNEGAVESMTFNELKSIAKENEAKYEKYYRGAPVVAQGYVDSVSYDYWENGNRSISYDSVQLADGLKVKVLHDSCEILVDLSKGDKVQIITNIAGTASFLDFYGASKGGGYDRNTLASTRISKVDFFQQVNMEEALTPSGTDTVQEAFDKAIEELTFVQKYAGNVNTSGSRKFADSKIESIKHCLDGIDNDYVNAHMPDIAKALPSINEDIEKVVSLLINMGETNSDKNVNEIKTLAGSIIYTIQTLIKTLK